MKIMKVNSYTNFLSSAVNSGSLIDDVKQDTKDEKQKKEKIIKYSLAAAVSAAVIIGGLYYLKRHGKLKPVSSSKDDINICNKQENAVNGVKKETENLTPAAKKSDETDIKTTDIEKKEDIKDFDEQNFDNVLDNADTQKKKPFELNEKYSDFGKIEGNKVEDGVIQQLENGVVRREFASDDGKHIFFYSEFDETGNRLFDVEFRNDGTVKAITKYVDGEFSEISFYKKDGETLEKTFDNLNASISFSLNFK